MNETQSITRFILRCLLAALPLVALVAFYLIADPFRVVRYHDPACNIGSPIPSNKGYISTVAYLNGREKYRYNAFIFGSSRSQYFPVKEWTRHLGKDASPFHFDASSESLTGIAQKMRFIEQHGDTIRYALIEIAPWGFKPGDNRGFSFRTPWQLEGIGKLPQWEYDYLRDFMQRHRLVALMRYYITGEAINPSTEKRVFFTPNRSIDPITNEVINDSIERLIALSPHTFYRDRAELSRLLRVSRFHYETTRIRPREIRALAEIADIMRRHHTDYRIIIGPDADRNMLMPSTRAVLDSLFAPSRVHDMTLFLPAVTDTTAYYDHTHFRPHIATMMLDEVYNAL